jgi:hypothetical protein
VKESRLLQLRPLGIYDDMLAVIYETERGVIYFKRPLVAQSETLEACLSGHVPEPNVWMGFVPRRRAKACAQLLRDIFPMAKDRKALVVLDPLESDIKV